MKEDLRAYIKSFQMLNDDEIDLIVESIDVQQFKKGEVLLREGQIASKCYLVLKGCIRQYNLKDGQEKSTAFFLEGESVSSFTSASNQAPSKHFLVCAEDCVLTIGGQDLETEMCEKIPRLKNMIQGEVEKVAGEMQDRFSSFVSSSPEERYKNLLHTKPTLFNRVPQHQIASYLGITPESLSRLRKRIYGKK